MHKSWFCKALAFVTLFGAAFAGCGGGEDKKTESSVSQEGRVIRLSTLYNGEEIDPLPRTIRDYLSLTEEEEQLVFLTEHEGENCYKPFYAFEWQSDFMNMYTVQFATDAEFSDAISVDCAMKYEMRDFGVCNRFVPGIIYFWRVVDDMGNSSITDSFIVKDSALRMIDVGGSFNVRDIGGWQTEGGGKVPYGRIYRGGRLNEITDAGIATLKDILGVKTELDLRSSRDDGGQESCSLGESVYYTQISISQYACLIPEFRRGNRGYVASTANAMRSIFDVLANEENYPVYLHCNAGADRTGSLTYLINGLLGVSYEDLTKDFELTSFSQSGARWRGSIEDGVLTSGVMQDDSGNYVGFAEMHDLIMEHYETEAGTLSSAIENYLIKGCGISKETVEKVKKNIMG